jgi:hypothetical protein
MESYVTFQVGQEPPKSAIKSVITAVTTSQEKKTSVKNRFSRLFSWSEALKTI